MRIKVNKARCRLCGAIIESKHRHDFVQCPCGNIAVDGGRDYLRRAGNPNNVEELSEYEPELKIDPPFQDIKSAIDSVVDALVRRQEKKRGTES
mgnify:FL=1